jgi:hypothetical protein
MSRRLRTRLGAHCAGRQCTRNGSPLSPRPKFGNTAGLARVGLVFTVTYDAARHGEPVNAEPHKCAKIG